MSMFKNVNVVQYHVSNWEAAKQFYHDALGWPVAFSSDEAGWCKWGQPNETHIAINLWKAEYGPRPSHGAVAVLSVDDAHATAAALKAKGIKVDDVIAIPNMVTYGTFYDLEGNSIQFASMPPAA